jgi:hypothetical protein
MPNHGNRFGDCIGDIRAWLDRALHGNLEMLDTFAPLANTLKIEKTSSTTKLPYCSTNVYMFTTVISQFSQKVVYNITEVQRSQEHSNVRQIFRENLIRWCRLCDYHVTIGRITLLAENSLMH